MFSLVSGIYESYWASPQLNLLVVGAQGVGKTTLLERIKVTQFHKKPPPPPSSAQTSNHEQQQQQHNNEGRNIDDLLIQAFLTSLSGKLEENDVQSPPVASPTNIKESATAANNSTTNINTKKQRLAWVCPAPKRYANAAVDDNDDNNNADEKEPKMTAQEKAEERTGSMESIDLVRETGSRNDSTSTTNATTGGQQVAAVPSKMGFDVKPGAKMISLHRIRPTIGMNLGKVELCGAKCHFWDLGGRLQDLWERYYLDCDAVVFVWKIQEHGNSNNSNKQDKDDDDDDSDDEIPEVTPQLQQGLLEKVRNAIPDDVPFLVLGHVFGNANSCLASLQSSQQRPQKCLLEMDKLYDTNRLLPHYHNPHQAVCLASAISGQGVRFAMEWLIPLAKRQHKIRDQQQRSASLAAGFGAASNGNDAKDL